MILYSTFVFHFFLKEFLRKFSFFLRDFAENPSFVRIYLIQPIPRFKNQLILFINRDFITPFLPLDSPSFLFLPLFFTEQHSKPLQNRPKFDLLLAASQKFIFLYRPERDLLLPRPPLQLASSN